MKLHSLRLPLPASRLSVRVTVALAAIFALLSVTGCSSIGTQIGQINNQLGTISTQFSSTINSQKTLIDNQQQLITNIQSTQQTIQGATAKTQGVLQKDVTAVVDLLRAVPATGLPPRATAALAGALAYATAAQTESGGVYLGADRVDASQIATGEISLPAVQTAVGVDLATYTQAHTDLVAAQTKLSGLQDNLATTSASLSDSNRQLQGTNGELSALRRQLTWEKIWAYLKTPLGLVLVGALIIAFPALIPIIGSLIGHIVSMFPAMMSFFGVASKNTIHNVAQGVGNFKDELDKLGADAQVKVSDVKAILSRELSTATDSLDRRVIDHVRNTKNIS